MKFNERLIKLRKAKGMSQEDLGYELNVTRQTISKWELGESTPEMEKLIQISNYFGVSVDELISNNDETTSSKNYNKEFVGVDEKYIPNEVKSETSYVNANKSSKKMMAIPIIFLAIPIIMFIVMFIFGISRIGKTRDRMQEMEEEGIEMIDSMQQKAINLVEDKADTEEWEKRKEEFNEEFNEAQDNFNKVKEQANEEFNEEQDNFNKVKEQANEEFNEEQDNFNKMKEQAETNLNNN